MRIDPRVTDTLPPVISAISGDRKGESIAARSGGRLERPSSFSKPTIKLLKAKRHRACSSALRSTNFAPMKKIVITMALLVAAAMGNAQQSGFGLGIMLGDPTGLSGKAWISSDRAIDFGLAWGVWGRYLHLHGDYLFHKQNLFAVSSGSFALHYGPGVRIRSWRDGRYWRRGRWYDYDGSRTSVGFRIPVGLTYAFEGAPVDAFIELAPTLDLVPGTYFDLDAAIGARFWF